MLESIMASLNGFMDAVGIPWNLVLVSIVMTFIATLAYKAFTNQSEMKELKAEIKELQKKMKEHKDDPSKMMEFQKRAMDRNMKYMMKSFKPTLITIIPFLLIFTWLRGYFTNLGNPDVLFGLSWLWSYIILSIVASIIIRKILKVH